MIILDTSFLIGLLSKKDQYHSRSSSLIQTILARKYGSLILTDYIFDEFVTLLRSRVRDKKKVLLISERLLNDKHITFLFINKEIFQEAWGLFKKHNHLSFTDAATVSLAKKLNVKYICSFDNDFDHFSFMERIY